MKKNLKEDKERYDSYMESQVEYYINAMNNEE